jgi:hypothetical protein
MPELIPFRWPKEWTEASRLSLLQGTPFNCIVGETQPTFSLGNFKFVKLEKEKSPEGIDVRGGVWPRVLPATKKDAADAGATGGAWVDSNAGFIRVGQTMSPGKPVWLDYSPPGGNDIVPLDRYAVAVAEALAYGGQWIVTLSADFLAGLEKNSPEVLAAWKRMLGVYKFFDSRPAWKTWKVVASLAVVSSFEGDIRMLSEEFVKMTPRRHLSHTIIRSADLATASLAGLKAIIYIETGPPEGALRAQLLKFVEAGGLLISPSGIVTGQPSSRRIGYEIHTLGKGQIAVPLEPWYDPFLLVAEAHQLMSHREDVVRVWNGGDMNSHFLSDPAGARGVVHLIQYPSGKTLPVTVGVKRQYTAVRVSTLESSKIVRAARGDLGFEIPVGEFSGYAAVELGA